MTYGATHRTLQFGLIWSASLAVTFPCYLLASVEVSAWNFILIDISFSLCGILVLTSLISFCREALSNSQGNSGNRKEVSRLFEDTEYSKWYFICNICWELRVETFDEFLLKSFAFCFSQVFEQPMREGNYIPQKYIEWVLHRVSIASSENNRVELPSQRCQPMVMYQLSKDLVQLVSKTIG